MLSTQKSQMLFHDAGPSTERKSLRDASKKQMRKRRPLQSDIQVPSQTDFQTSFERMFQLYHPFVGLEHAWTCLSAGRCTGCFRLLLWGFRTNWSSWMSHLERRGGFRPGWPRPMTFDWCVLTLWFLLLFPFVSSFHTIYICIFLEYLRIQKISDWMVFLDRNQRFFVVPGFLAARCSRRNPARWEGRETLAP